MGYSSIYNFETDIENNGYSNWLDYRKGFIKHFTNLNCQWNIKENLILKPEIILVIYPPEYPGVVRKYFGVESKIYKTFSLGFYSGNDYFFLYSGISYKNKVNFKVMLNNHKDLYISI